MPRIAVLIVAAGKGERSGRAKPKQYEALPGKPMLRPQRRGVRQLCPSQVVIGPGQEALYAAALPDGAAAGDRRRAAAGFGAAGAGSAGSRCARFCPDP